MSFHFVGWTRKVLFASGLYRNYNHNIWHRVLVFLPTQKCYKFLVFKFARIFRQSETDKVRSQRCVQCPHVDFTLNPSNLIFEDSVLHNGYKILRRALFFPPDTKSIKIWMIIIYLVSPLWGRRGKKRSFKYTHVDFKSNKLIVWQFSSL